MLARGEHDSRRQQTERILNTTRLFERACTIPLAGRCKLEQRGATKRLDRSRGMRQGPVDRMDQIDRSFKLGFGKSPGEQFSTLNLSCDRIERKDRITHS